MNGRDFEREVLQLLEAQGFVAEMTEATADGGIDIVAKRTDPLLAGKYIVQCKNWTKPVGAPVVRDLYGVIMAENANKGILITTSRFTDSARAFAENKPIELIDGSAWKALISPTSSSQTQHLKELELAEETRRVFVLAEDLAVWVKKFLADLDAIHDDLMPTVLFRNELDEAYRCFSLGRTLKDAHKTSQDLLDHFGRWVKFIQATNWTTPHKEAADEFEYYIQRWQHLLHRLLSIYKALHRASFDPALKNAHLFALEGIYHLASGGAFALWKCEKQYDEIEDKITLVIEAEQELFDYHFDKATTLLVRAAKELTAAEGEGYDELFEEAKALVMRHERASASFLQRRLGIGYPRAARLIEQLEKAGIVGRMEADGRSRKVLTEEPKQPKSWWQRLFGR